MTNNVPMSRIAQFNSFSEITVKETALPKVKTKSFLCFKWNVYLMASVKNDSIEFVYLNKIEKFVRNFFRSLYTPSTDITRLKDFFVKKGISTKDETIPTDRKAYIEGRLLEYFRQINSPKFTYKRETYQKPELSRVADLKEYVQTYNKDKTIAVLNKIADENCINKPLADTIYHTPLTFALHNHSTDAFIHLIDTLQVDVNALTKDGKSPLQLAIESDCPKPYLQILIERGASIPKKQQAATTKLINSLDEYHWLRKQADEDRKAFFNGEMTNKVLFDFSDKEHPLKELSKSQP